ncbi:BREX-2 system adenine-specific DNA-methyltransferase PglX [Nonomuraea sp. NEAU-A123]|uniref:BREX-2 system adenine-specific DNA-methyltransferase PglX n=1 Tax=Nonomuraea sp. NEAU-A123 TaxID=2839649 RepID=UPI001BE49089|nr:BREX-2 system adenine-specific DNA-methyltransferase PglX [Nonomuraea sp. NEAU-A123]MBT2234454.1 BREX-2 system adenine-specific DNA-methyltransferase PglX [Nonomuraea sp. NEAU-A123]
MTEVIDTSGAYIPGHGTPTVILVGTRRTGRLRSETVRTVRSVQGEPSTPEDGEEGLVWRAIVEQIDQPGSVSPWVSVDDLERERYFGKQPWILAAGGLEMVETISASSHATLAGLCQRIGFVGMTHSDDVMIRPGRCWRGPVRELTMPIAVGEDIRSWMVLAENRAFFPYAKDRSAIDMPDTILSSEALWPYRAELGNRATFSGATYFSAGRPWWEWHQLPRDANAHSWALAFAFVSTHNEFALDRVKFLFKQTAPVIKLLKSVPLETHLWLLGLLNSATACFWLKMVSYPKGGDPMGDSGARVSIHPWSDRYEFTGTKLQQFPLPADHPTVLATSLDSLASEQIAVSPYAVAAATAPTAAALREAKAKWHSVRARMIALQEELDWQVYSLYNLHSEDLRTPEEADIPEIALGERAFEIVLARKVAKGEASDEWFKRHGFAMIQEVQDRWPEPYKQVVQKRINVIESSRAIGMIERPEYKRRWATEGWDALQEKALRSWLLERIEKRKHWYDENGQPAIVTLARLVDALSRDEDFVSVAALYAPRRELIPVVADLMADEHVPFLATLRYKPSGLKRRVDWEQIWAMQRQEDAAPNEPVKRKIRDSIPVPPKYTSADFVKPSYWRARGKLDVPKERFISYSLTTSGTPDLYGWAGWDHREQAQALATYFTNHPLTDEEITPFLAGLLELQQWLYQWHHEFDAMYSGSPADFFASYRQQIQGEHGLTDDDLRDWRPSASARRWRTAPKR